MTRRSSSVAFSLVALLWAAGTQPVSMRAQEVLDQRVLATQLLGSDKAQRDRALAAIRGLEPARIGPELRGALIAALERENARTRIRHEAGERGETLEPREDDFYGNVAEAVAALRDPRSIPALAGALGTGLLVVRALAAFGELAVPAVLAVVTSPASLTHEVDDGLRTLTLMVENRASAPLSEGTLGRLRQVAGHRLSGKSFVTTLCSAIDLAAALDDRALTETIERLATEPQEAIARGVTDPSDIERVQRRAAVALARAHGGAPLR